MLDGITTDFFLKAPRITAFLLCFQVYVSYCYYNFYCHFVYISIKVFLLTLTWHFVSNNMIQLLFQLGKKKQFMFEH